MDEKSSSIFSHPSSSGLQASELPLATNIPVKITSPSNFLDLPIEIVHKVFKYLTFEQISKIRIVCSTFNRICSDILNNEFNSVRNYTQELFQSVKSQMPRRESARRKHSLAREYDIIETLNMRLTLLQMTFSKHIKHRNCCFFPGEIIDEVHRILFYVKQTPVVNRAYKVTDELFDLSTMAIEYFKESIEPRLPDISYFGIMDYEPLPSFTTIFVPSSNVQTSSNVSENSISKASCETPVCDISEDSYRYKIPVSFESCVKSSSIRIKRLEKANSKNNLVIEALKTSLESCKRKFNDAQNQLKKHQTQLDEAEKRAEALNLKLSQMLEEMDQLRRFHKSCPTQSTSTQTSQSQDDTGNCPRKRIKLSQSDEK